jgi:hypothetical protein
LFLSERMFHRHLLGLFSHKVLRPVVLSVFLVTLCVAHPVLDLGQHPNIFSIGVQISVDISEQMILDHTDPSGHC